MRKVYENDFTDEFQEDFHTSQRKPSDERSNLKATPIGQDTGNSRQRGIK